MLNNSFFGDHFTIQACFNPDVKHAWLLRQQNARMSLGERIKARRGKMPVAELAAAAGVSAQAVYAWESGDTKGLKPENLVVVAKKIRTTEEWLATGAGHEDRLPDDAEKLARDWCLLDAEYKGKVRGMVSDYMRMLRIAPMFSRRAPDGLVAKHIKAAPDTPSKLQTASRKSSASGSALQPQPRGRLK